MRFLIVDRYLLSLFCKALFAVSAVMFLVIGMIIFIIMLQRYNWYPLTFKEGIILLVGELADINHKIMPFYFTEAAVILVLQLKHFNHLLVMKLMSFSDIRIMKPIAFFNLLLGFFYLPVLHPIFLRSMEKRDVLRHHIVRGDAKNIRVAIHDIGSEASINYVISTECDQMYAWKMHKHLKLVSFGRTLVLVRDIYDKRNFFITANKAVWYPGLAKWKLFEVKVFSQISQEVIAADEWAIKGSINYPILYGYIRSSVSGNTSTHSFVDAMDIAMHSKGVANQSLSDEIYNVRAELFRLLQIPFNMVIATMIGFVASSRQMNVRRKLDIKLMLVSLAMMSLYFLLGDYVNGFIVANKYNQATTILYPIFAIVILYITMLHKET